MLELTRDRCSKEPSLKQFLPNFENALKDARHKEDHLFIYLYDDDEQRVVAYAFVTEKPLIDMNVEKPLCFLAIMVAEPFKWKDLGADLVFWIRLKFSKYFIFGWSVKNSPLNSMYEELGATITPNRRFLKPGHPYKNNESLIAYCWNSAQSSATDIRYGIKSSQESLPTATDTEGASTVEYTSIPCQVAGPQLEGIPINFITGTAAIQNDGTWRFSDNKYSAADSVRMIAVQARANSVGLIYQKRGTRFRSPLGTGWVLATKLTENDPELIVTNKHVAKMCYSLVRTKYKSSRQMFIKFNDELEIEIKLLCWIGNYDIAFFTPKNTSLPKDMEAIPLSPESSNPGTRCFTIGFPYPDAREVLLKDEGAAKKYFPDGLEKKTISLGEVIADQDKIHVKSYTLGGNSGSPVMNDKGQVIGLHFGPYKEGPATLWNMAEPARILKEAELYARECFDDDLDAVNKT